jgi:hypothetical protein
VSVRRRVAWSPRVVKATSYLMVSKKPRTRSPPQREQHLVQCHALVIYD